MYKEGIMGIPTIDEIVSLIDCDIAIYETIKSEAMTEKASWAREALLNYKMYDVRFGRYQGEKYTFAVYNPEADQWWDITGHYHFAPPDEKIIQNKKRIEEYEEKQSVIIQTIIKVREDMGVPVKNGNVQDFYENYYEIRNRIKKKCTVCGKSGGGRRYEWHHLDHSLLRELNKAKEIWDSINPMENREKFYAATKEYTIRAMKYYTDDLSQTVLLCKKCHAGVHSGKIDLSEVLNE